jgi:hypothetical protein
MGAHNLAHTIVASTMKEAYENAVSTAKSEHGHNDCRCHSPYPDYNGTISTTDGFIDKTARYESLVKNHGKHEGLSKWEEEGWDETEKWGEVWGTLIETQKNKKNSYYTFVGWAAE